MGLRDTIRNLANNAITSTIGDLASSATFRAVVTGEYDPASGTVTQTVTEYVVACVKTGIKQSDVVDMSVAATGAKLLVPALQLDGVSVDALDDEVSVDGVKYLVHTVKLDPAGALLTFIITAQEGTQLNGN